jgi:hypothetical protein
MTVDIDPGYIVDPFRRTGKGFRETIKGVAPAAGADYAVTMDPRYVTLLESVFVHLVTDANAANREVVLEYRTGEALRFAVFGAPTVVTATTTVEYSFVAGLPSASWPIDSTILVPFEPLPLVGSESFRLHVVNMQATDALTLIRYTWQRFFTDESR